MCPWDTDAPAPNKSTKSHNSKMAKVKNIKNERELPLMDANIE